MQCWSADLINMFDIVFPDLNSVHELEVAVSNEYSLPAIGEYHVLSLEKENNIAITTIASVDLANEIANLKVKGVSIVGKSETENIGIEKIIQNINATSNIKYLIVCGKESNGHNCGNSLVSLKNNGVDENKKIIDAKGRKAVLSNLEVEEIQLFRKQIQIIDMIGIEDLDTIIKKVSEINEASNHNEVYEKEVINKSNVEIINVAIKDPYRIALDKEGYFVIVVKEDSKKIYVEHFSNKNELLHIISGDNARDIYWCIIDNNWISEISHAAYLGKELTLAQLSLDYNFKYIQDKA